MKWLGKKRLQSVLGLTLDGSQFRASHMVRARGAIERNKSVAATLSLDLSHPEVELIGQEIRNRLEAAGIRERHCVAVVPASWVMSQHTTLPDLPPEDATSFLQLEAEKGFPCDLDELQVVRSTYRSGSTTYVTQLAVRKEQLERLTSVLKAAGLKPVSFSLGLSAQPDVIPPAGQGRISVAFTAGGATLLFAAGGGIAAFRTAEATIDSEAGERLLNQAAVSRELRITHEQVPLDLRQEMRKVSLCGDEALVRPMAESLAGWATAAGLTLEQNGTPEGRLADEMGENVASNFLEKGVSELEFLPPRPGRWATFMARYSSKRLATAGFAVGGLALIALVAFGWLEFRHWSLGTQWAAMETEVKDLKTVKERIREFRGYYDITCRNLSIMKRVTEAFPETGTVTAKTFEIHNVTNTGLAGAARDSAVNVSISGTARDNTSLLKTFDLLRKAPDLQGLKIENIRGKTPLQFTFSFRWTGSTGL